MAGFFSRLFGGGKENGPQDTRSSSRLDTSAKTAMSSVPERKTPQHLVSEVRLPETTREYKEGAKTIQFAQCTYGKLVQFEGGPILPGIDYSVTGTSPDFKDVFKILSLARGVFGVGDASPWYVYPWRGEGGGIEKINVEINGEPMVLVARFNAYTEDGAAGRQRDFQSAHFAMVSGKDWSVAVIPQLVEKLSTEPGVEKTAPLSPLEFGTDVLDRDLQEHWFDDSVKELLVRVISGKTIAIHEKEKSVKQFLDTVFLCELCLPENTARNMSFGSGLFSSEKVRMSTAMSARGDMKKEGGVWQGDQNIDFGLSNEYVSVLESKLAGCKTPRDVMKAVDSLPRDLIEKVEKRIVG